MERSQELSMDRAFLQKLNSAVFANLNNEQFGAEDLANEVGLSRSQIHRKLQKINGKSITQFIREIRLQEAHRLLEEEAGTASEISCKVGFSSPTYFNRCFSEYYGYPPGEVKNKKKEISTYNKQTENEEAKIIPIHGEENEISVSTDHEIYKDDRRKLSTIMFTDIVGYTALMEKDERKALELLERNRMIQQPLIEIYHGRQLKEMGDGMLASFESVSDAVHCAQEILRVSKEDRVLKLHIGIHLGEVIFSDGDVFGDAVNIASRIQAAAKESEIYISEEVWKNIKNKGGFQVEYVGEKSFKNVDEPLRLYKIKELDPEIQMHDKRSPSTFWKLIGIVALITIAGLAIYLYRNIVDVDRSLTTSGSDKAIVLLPFKYIGDEETKYLAPGLNSEVAASLRMIQELKVFAGSDVEQLVSRGLSGKEMAELLSAPYILEGSVLAIKDSFKLNIHLTDVANTLLWQDSFYKDESLMAMVLDVAKDIVGSLEIIFTKEDENRIFQTSTTSPEAYHLTMQGEEL